MAIELLRDWKGYRAGRVLDMPDGPANVLIKRKIAKPADGDKAETAKGKRKGKK